MNHTELAEVIRLKIKLSTATLRQLEAETGVSRSYLSAFANGQTVCFDIINRLANNLNVNYEITNEDLIDNPDVYVDKIVDLIWYLRDQLRVTESVNRISIATGFKKSSLYAFRNGEAVCLTKMDSLCEFYRIMYKISNHPNELTKELEWAA